MIVLFFLPNALLVPFQGYMGLSGQKGEGGPEASLPCAVLMLLAVLKHVEMILNVSLNRSRNAVSLIALLQGFVAIETSLRWCR